MRDGTELAESGLKILDIPAAMNSGAGGSPESPRNSPRNQKMAAERAELAQLGTHAHSIPFCVPQQKNVEASYAAHSERLCAGDAVPEMFTAVDSTGVRVSAALPNLPRIED